MATKSTRIEKIEWLLAHQELWERFSADRLPMDARWKSIVEKMREAGLVSWNTRWQDVNVRNLIIDARTIRRIRASGIEPALTQGATK
jgi:hypothetical protein